MPIERLTHLKEQYNKTGNREFLKEAFALCKDNGLSLPDWVLHGIAPFITNPGLDERLETLHQAYQAGCLGALLEAVAACGNHYPLPMWANFELKILFRKLVDGKAEKIPRKWKKWADRYRLDMIDLQEQETTEQLCDEGYHKWQAELGTAIIFSRGKTEGSPFKQDKGKKVLTKEAITKSNQHQKTRHQENPYRYIRLLTYRIINRSNSKAETETIIKELGLSLTWAK